MIRTDYSQSQRTRYADDFHTDRDRVQIKQFALESAHEVEAVKLLSDLYVIFHAIGLIFSQSVPIIPARRPLRQF